MLVVFACMQKVFFARTPHYDFKYHGVKAGFLT